jgi:KaiC/GvpD/RAD55 family RecA-like ATPase
MRFLKTGIQPVDEELGGVVERSLILLHEADPRSLGKLIAFELLKKKIDEDQLIGYFNIGAPMNLLLELFNKMEIDYERAFEKGILFIVDTFGSVYDHRIEHRNIQYLKKPISLETLNNKYLEVIEEHKKTWAENGMFEGREVWGITVSMSDYKWMFGEEPTLRYLEFVDAQRRTADVYKKYPSGTNIWIYSGTDNRILPFLYRKADYVLRTYSTLEDDKVIRKLRISKTPKRDPIREFEYTIEGHRVVFG